MVIIPETKITFDGNTGSIILNGNTTTFTATYDKNENKIFKVELNELNKVNEKNDVGYLFQNLIQRTLCRLVEHTKNPNIDYTFHTLRIRKLLSYVSHGLKDIDVVRYMVEWDDDKVGFFEVIYDDMQDIVWFDNQDKYDFVFCPIDIQYIIWIVLLNGGF